MIGRVFVVVRAISFDQGVGGLERAASDQVVGLQALGWEVVLLSPSRFTRGEIPTAHIDIRWPAFAPSSGAPGFGLAYQLWVARARKVLRRELAEGDALYVHGGGAGVLRGLPRRAGVVLANPHGMEEFRSGGLLRWTNRVFTRRLARAARRADTIIATDELLVSAVEQHIGVVPEKVVVIPNGVNVARLDALAADGEIAEAADIVSVGRLVHNKGYDLLAEALALVLEAEPTRLLWRHFGDGPERELIVRRSESIRNLRLEVVSGAADAEVQRQLAAARVFVQPSRYEGSSLTTLEAMAQRCVAVGTSVGGIPEKVIDGVTGYLAAVDAPAIAEAIRRALGADQGIASRARARVEAKYDIKAVASQLSEALSGENG